MKMLLHTGGSLIVVGSLLCTSALTEAAKPNRSASARTALCKADCLPDNDHKNGIGMHGLYRSYSRWDPHLVSPEGKKEYAECVRACAAPLPSVYVQRLIFAMGMKWFGMTQQTCFDCHSQAGPHHLLPSTGVSVLNTEQ
jgi:hypothetical protein